MLAFLVATSIAHTWPKNLTDSVGGFSLSKSTLTNACWFDSRSGFFVVKNYDCDGAHRSIRLTRDRRLVEDSGFDVPAFGMQASDFGGPKIEAREFALATKSGIKIGDSLQSIQKRLGKPNRSMTKGTYMAILYRHIHMDDKENGAAMRNTYIFKQGKLIEVLLSLDSIPGCGEDGNDETGWPWTKF